MDIKEKLKERQFLVAGFFVLIAFLAIGGWRFYVLDQELKSLETKYAQTKSELESNVENLENEKIILSEALYSEQAKNQEFEDQINDIADTVGVLEKLKNTDPELLQKYSKVYFLNEHYIPSALTEIDSKYVLSYKDQWIHKQTWRFLEDMIEDAKDDKIDLRVVSGYRTFDEQQDLKGNYVVVYGEGTANQFSAEQGYSEHQLGTTVDFTTPELGQDFSGFAQTKAYEWLQKNAYKYGFVLSYPENNSYYQYEPWHWRFVGKDLARRLDRDNKNFYDMEQRDINEYLVSLFD